MRLGYAVAHHVGCLLLPYPEGELCLGSVAVLDEGALHHEADQVGVHVR